MDVITNEMHALKTRLKATWEAGDYGHFAKAMEPGALEFLARLDIKPGDRVLDVACGAGQTAIPLAQAGAQVVGIDIAANLVDQARAAAKAANVTAQFDEGDAEAMPYASQSFDAVITLIGAMFAPRPDRVASELVRVCRPGGRVIMANWTAEGFVGLLFKTMAKHVTPPAIMPSPLLWGNEAVVSQRFKEHADAIEFSKQSYPFFYPFSPGEVVEYFRAYYGPTNRAFATLDPEAQARLRADLTELWSNHNKGSAGTTQYTAEYLQVIVRPL